MSLSVEIHKSSECPLVNIRYNSLQNSDVERALTVLDSEGVVVEYRIETTEKCDEYQYVFIEADIEELQNTEVKTTILKDTMNRMKYNTPFEFSMLRRTILRSSEDIETAVSYFDEDIRKFSIIINEKFVQYISDKTGYEVENVCQLILEHELKHIMLGHLRIGEDDISDFERCVLNQIQDLYINQNLQQKFRMNIPVGLIDTIQVSGKFRKGMTVNRIYKLADYRSIWWGIYPNNEEVIESGSIIWTFRFNESMSERFLYEGFLEFCDDIFEPETLVFGMKPLTGFDDMLKVSDKSLEQLCGMITSSLEKKCYNEDFDLCESLLRERNSKKSNVDWRWILNKEIRNTLGSEEKYLVNEPSARVEGQFGRDIDCPAIKRVTYAIDVSGSMQIEDYQFCMNEIEAIYKSLKIQRMDLTVLWWGTNIIEEKFRTYNEFKKRCEEETPSLGGTNVNKIIHRIEELRPQDLVVLFTDGQFSEVDRINRKVLFCITPEGTSSMIPKYSKYKVITTNK